MELKEAKEVQTSTSVISEFKGYNHNLRSNAGEFYDMKNMSSDHYPLLSSRAKRGYIRTLTKCQGIDASDKLFWVDNNEFYYNGVDICTVSDGEKHFVQMGAYVCIFPDKIAYNTYTDELFDLEHSETFSGVKLSLCKMDGTVYDSDHLWVGTTEPSDRTEYPTWLDLSSTPTVLKIYSENESQWVSVPTTYVKIEAEDIGEGIREDDAITISGCDIDDFNTSMIIKAKGDDYLVVIGLLDEGVHTNSTDMTFAREMPDVDFVCEHNNRLWGCSSANHEIYASKQGDPSNWNYFGGITSDSYAATVGTYGEFTGCIGYLDYVLFFKENGMHKIYGSSPSTYQLTWTEMRGVQKGSEKSLVVLNESLFYKANEGVCVYQGSMPTNITTGFAQDRYFDAVAGQCNEKYYISMRDKNYKYKLFVFDTKTQLWHKEDDLRIYGFGMYNGACYMVDQYQKMWVFPYEAMESYVFPGMTHSVSGVEMLWYPKQGLYPGVQVEGQYEDDVEWMAETGDMGLDNPYHKYVSRIVLRMMIDMDASMKVEIQYDSCGEWDTLLEMIGKDKKSYNIPLRVNRCDHYRLRLSGVGDCKIYSLTQVIESGSEL